jgi:hypothetical protein
MGRAGTAAGHDLPNSVLSGGSEATYDQNLGAFRRGMRDLEYIEGKTFKIEARFAEGKFERLPSQLTYGAKSWASHDHERSKLLKRPARRPC